MHTACIFDNNIYLFLELFQLTLANKNKRSYTFENSLLLIKICKACFFFFKNRIEIVGRKSSIIHYINLQFVVIKCLKLSIHINIFHSAIFKSCGIIDQFLSWCKKWLHKKSWLSLFNQFNFIYFLGVTITKQNICFSFAFSFKKKQKQDFNSLKYSLRILDLKIAK